MSALVQRPLLAIELHSPAFSIASEQTRRFRHFYEIDGYDVQLIFRSDRFSYAPTLQIAHGEIDGRSAAVYRSEQFKQDHWRFSDCNISVALIDPFADFQGTSFNRSRSIRDAKIGAHAPSDRTQRLFILTAGTYKHAMTGELFEIAH